MPWDSLTIRTAAGIQQIQLMALQQGTHMFWESQLKLVAKVFRYVASQSGGVIAHWPQLVSTEHPGGLQSAGDGKVWLADKSIKGKCQGTTIVKCQGTENLRFPLYFNRYFGEQSWASDSTLLAQWYNYNFHFTCWNKFASLFVFFLLV